ncbi:receptor activity-modifying protein 1-like, partial [Clarias magur]
QKTEGLLRSKGRMNGDVVYEDQENFQYQEKTHHYHRCNETLLYAYGYNYCLENFAEKMATLGKENWCDWEQVL